jgi:hypothetical protein
VVLGGVFAELVLWEVEFDEMEGHNRTLCLHNLVGNNLREVERRGSQKGQHTGGREAIYETGLLQLASGV